MRTARTYHTATLLRDGRVLVAGGYTGPLGTVVLRTTELYDPVSNSWSEAAPMLVPHASQAAATLPDGKVLIVSGRSSSGDTREAEIYNPGTNSWSRAGNLSVARVEATALPLPTGKILIIGGGDGTVGNPPAELYDPSANNWTQVPNTTAHHVNLAVSLATGKVLVLGDLSNWSYQFSAEYDPSRNTWSSVDRPPVALAGGVVLLGNGSVLLFGNRVPGGDTRIIELYDPAGHTWVGAAPMVANGVFGTATALSDGAALVAGAPGSMTSPGCGSTGDCTNAEIYDPTHDSWMGTPGMATSRDSHTATLLTTGKVLVAGGFVPPNPDAIASSEIFDPAK
jgi:Galactose oxidase, central domain